MLLSSTELRKVSASIDNLANATREANDNERLRTMFLAANVVDAITKANLCGENYTDDDIYNVLRTLGFEIIDSNTGKELEKTVDRELKVLETIKDIYGHKIMTDTKKIIERYEMKNNAYLILGDEKYKPSNLLEIDYRKAKLLKEWLEDEN